MPESVAAYILIQTEASAGEVAVHLRKLDGVERAEDVSGPYDVIARVTAADMDSLGKLVVSRVQAVPGITRTLTCPVVQL